MKKLRWAVLVAGVIIVFILLTFANSLVGNPVSKALARRAAVGHIEQNYSGMDLKLEKVVYNFKFSSYLAFVQSESSPDTAFSIYFDSWGKVKHDDYDYEVANNFTTWRRLDQELRIAAEEILIGNIDYDVDHASFSFLEKGNGNEDLLTLTRDMELDICDPPLPLSVSVAVFSDDLSYETIAAVAKDIQTIVSEKKIPISSYCIRILPLANKPENDEGSASWMNSISIDYFPAEKLKEDNLPQFMEQFEAKRVESYNETHKK